MKPFETPTTQPNEFVVDSGDVPVVRKLVDSFINEPSDSVINEPAVDDRLGLALITLNQDAGRVADAIEAGMAAAGLPSPGGAAGSDIDRLIADLRTALQQIYGWYPTIGKNRVLRGVQLLPYPSFGGSIRLPADGPCVEIPRGAEGRGVRVGILDTPIYANDRLAGKYLADDENILRRNGAVRKWWEGHATFLAGVVAQLAPAAEIVVHSMLGSPDGTAPVWEVARRLVRMADDDLDIVNLSFGCYTDDGRPPLVLDRAIQRLTSSAVIVAAAGNHGDAPATPGALPAPNTPLWPAAFGSPGVIGVGACKACDTCDSGLVTASFTPRDLTVDPVQNGEPKAAPWIDLLAKGVDVRSLYLDGEVDLSTADGQTQCVCFAGEAIGDGTSYAAARVTGALAALTVPGRSAAQARDELMHDGPTQKQYGVRLP
jgi:membrane-anchored mycosin MYCP